MNNRLFLFGVFSFLIGFLILNSTFIQYYVEDLVSGSLFSTKEEKIDEYYEQFGGHVSRGDIEEKVNEEAEWAVYGYARMFINIIAYTLVFSGFIIVLLGFIVHKK